MKSFTWIKNGGLAILTTKRIFVITGPTGSGKTTVSHYLRSQYQIPQVITHTTRAPGKVKSVGATIILKLRRVLSRNII